MRRKTNAELVQDMRDLLTDGVFVVDPQTQIPVELPKGFLAKTAPWRRALWRKLNEIEERLCPEPSRPAS